MKKYVFFDIEGTLVHTQSAIERTLSHILKDENTDISPQEAARGFHDAPAVDALFDVYGFPMKKAEELSLKYYEYFKQNAVLDCSAREGIVAVLESLKKHEARLFAVSSMLHSAAVAVMKQTKLAPYFSLVQGASVGEALSSKEDIISFITDMAGIKPEDKDNIVLVGDEWRDKMAAQILEIDFVGAAYGYAPEEFSKLPGGKVAHTVKELERVLVEA